MAECIVTVQEEVVQTVSTTGETVVVEDQAATSVALSPGDITVTQEVITNVVSVGSQGPAGVPEEEKTYAKRIDTIDDSPSTDITTIYKGEAVVGSVESGSVWRLRRIRIDDNTDGDVEEVWAESGGNPTAEFVHIWDDRLSLTYS
jgi:hypothetical protein